MMKINAVLIFGAVLLTSCGGGGANSNANRSVSNAAVKTGVAPVPDPEVAVIEMETPAFGTIKIELYSNVAPKAVARFKELAKEGYYNGIAFHRINQSVIQAGDSSTKPGAIPKPDGRQGDSGKPNVEAEFSDVPYTNGIVGAASELYTRRYSISAVRQRVVAVAENILHERVAPAKERGSHGG